MIFVCVGSRDYQFNRLLKALDDLFDEGLLKDDVFAQIAKSDYEPKNYKWKRFLDKKEFERYQDRADLIITHAGTGAVIGALKKGKQVIAVPRLAKYGEHIDDHQTQVAETMANEGLLINVEEISKLGEAIMRIKKHPITKKYNKESNVLTIIEEFIENDQKSKAQKSLSPITKNIILTPFNLLYTISPKLTLKILFRIKLHRKLHIDKPVSYNEKLQWMKLYYKNPILPKLVDKYTVREYVNEKCPGILNNLIWEGFNPDDIPWNKLPQKCVIKVTHGSGFNIICESTRALDRKQTKKQLKKWLKAKFLRCYGEWFYGVEKPRIIIEDFIESKDLKDYKVFCFNGEPQYVGVYSGRRPGVKPTQEVYDAEWNLLDGFTGDYEHPAKLTHKPKQFKKLLDCARKLSSGFSHVRVDFYIENDRIYFGELTFTSGAGFDLIKPYSFEVEMGNKFILPEK